MNSHLSSEQLASWTAGERKDEIRTHLDQCAQCGNELAKFESVLLAFRSSVREWSEASAERQSPVVSEVRSWSYPGAWLAAGMTAVALMLCFYVGVGRHAAPPAAVLQTPAANDAALLRRVDSQISAAVPAPMESLTQLISWQPQVSRSEHAASEPQSN